MITIETIYNGQKYNDTNDALDKAFKDMFEFAKEKMEEYINKKLEPFKNEIEAHGGVITIDLAHECPDESLLIINVPDELKKKIKEAFKS